jgi:hypothetical protein
VKKYKIIFSENALLDIEEAVIYYNEQQKNLGKKFASEVQSTLKYIKTNPFYVSVRYDDIRCAVVDIFPFLVHYKIEADINTVKILSVYHTNKNPLWT